MVDPYTYQTARDLFEAARSARFEERRTMRTIGEMRAREGLRARACGAGGGGRPQDDPMRATDQRIDYERVCRRRVEEDRALVGFAEKVLFGDGGDGGLASLMGGMPYADVLHCYYCEAMTWQETAQTVGMSRRWCQDAASIALDTIDHDGLWRSMVGIGRAEG